MSTSLNPGSGSPVLICLPRYSYTYVGNINTESNRHIQARILVYRLLSSSTSYPQTVLAQKTVLLFDAPYGTLTQLWAGISAEGVGFHGKVRSAFWLFSSSVLTSYMSSTLGLIPWASIGTAQPESQDPETGKQL